MTDNLHIWRAVEKTDPAHTKGFSGKGGFKGTAISPMYLIHAATKLWGPMGSNWGVRIIEEKVLDGAPLILREEGKPPVVIGCEKLHTVRVEVYYPLAVGEGSVPGFGQTMLIGSNKYGYYTDEEAPKKSLTDALTKALSWLGFAADVHMGRYDDVKYVQRVVEEFKEAEAKAAGEEVRTRGLAILELAAKKGTKALEHSWNSVVSLAMRQACQADLARLKKEAAAFDKEPANA